MRARIQHIISLWVLTCAFQTSFCQSIYVKASIDRDKILIGEPIQLRLEASLPKGTTSNWFSLDSISHFEFIEKAKIDTLGTAGVMDTYNQQITITSFDSGRWVIPQISLELNGRSYLTDSLPVSVAFSNFDASQDYHDIKNILNVESVSLAYINYVVAAISVLSLLALIYFFRKKVVITPAAVTRTGLQLSPIEEALRLLSELKGRQLPQNGQIKSYYTGLNDIFRLFIARKLSFTTMQRTSEELIVQIKGLGLPEDTFVAVAQTLRMSDAVKFAKYIPDDEYNEESFRNIKISIETINNLKA